jgi:AraC-like DNA-binding protein
VRERHDAPLSLGDIAEEVGLSRERLSRLFHETLGITFSDYLAEVRLGRARQLLAEGSSPVTEIAFASGFQSISQFNRRFLQAEGVSPSEYRRQRSERL